MLRIWGRTNSINVQKVLWCAAELGLQYERIDAGLQFGINRDPWYLAMNPNGLVPTIDDDGFTLWESNSIVRYFAARYGGAAGIYPQDPRVRADAERWMDWSLGALNQEMRTIFWQLVRTPTDRRDGPLIEQSRLAVAELWRRLDGVLASRAYVAGDRFTVGDIPVGTWVYRWYALPIERPELPNLKAWYERLTRREGYRAHVMQPLS